MRNALSLEKMGPSWASGSSTSKVLDPTLKNDPTMALSRLNQIADGVCDTGCRTELPRGAPRSVRCRNQAITLKCPAQGHDECNGDLTSTTSSFRFADKPGVDSLLATRQCLRPAQENGTVTV